MTYTIDELFAAAEQEIEAWKSDAQKGYKSNDYMYLGFLRAVADRLQSNSQNSGKPDVIGSTKGCTCTARNCNQPAVGDYNGHGDYACQYHMDKWNDEFDDEYR